MKKKIVAMLIIIGTCGSISSYFAWDFFFNGNNNGENQDVPAILAYSPSNYARINETSTQEFNITVWFPGNDDINYEWRVNGTHEGGNFTWFLFDANGRSNGTYIIFVNVSSGPLTLDHTWRLLVSNQTGGFVIDHNAAHLEDLNAIPAVNIQDAKSSLHVVYWHTSHGSQLTDGMTDLDPFMGGSGLYTYNNGGTSEALDLDDHYDGTNDLSQNLDNFDDITSVYLEDPANLDVNVVMWSWCSLLTDFSEIDQYLSSMSQLELEYPDVSFVYMTGHLDGTGETGAVHIANERIRDYCLLNCKILYDFADIESYDPDDNYFLDLGADDGCNYSGGNWATQWQGSHAEGTYWYDCTCQHSQPLNGNMKAYGAWNLFARLAGWTGP